MRSFTEHTVRADRRTDSLAEWCENAEYYTGEVFKVEQNGPDEFVLKQYTGSDEWKILIAGTAGLVKAKLRSIVRNA